MKAILSFTVVFAIHVSQAVAQLSMDTARFNQPVLVEGGISGLYKWSNSLQSDSADVTILAPTEGQRFKSGDSIFVSVSVSGVAIGAQTQHANLCGLENSASGQHTHVILDNDACLANYTNGAPFFVGLATPGRHMVRVFASRSWHESIKSPGSFKAVTFLVDSAANTTPENSPVRSGLPLLTYSRPMGEYAGENARAIMIDFYLSNASLGLEADKVRLTIDSGSTVLTEWVPYIVTGLKPGEHRFKLELLTTAGDPVGGFFSTCEQKIIVK